MPGCFSNARTRNGTCDAFVAAVRTSRLTVTSGDDARHRVTSEANASTSLDAGAFASPPTRFSAAMSSRSTVARSSSVASRLVASLAPRNLSEQRSTPPAMDAFRRRPDASHRRTKSRPSFEASPAREKASRRRCRSSRSSRRRESEADSRATSRSLSSTSIATASSLESSAMCSLSSAARRG